MSENLGKASLDLAVELAKFKREMGTAREESDRVEHALEAVASVARVAETELNRVKMDAAQGTRSAAIADRIEGSVGHIGRAAMEANRHLEQVKLDAAQAAESEAAGAVFDHALNDITDNANQARHALDRLRLAGVGIGGVGETRVRGGVPGRSGVGVGPFGSGFGRVGLLGAAIGVGAITAPAAGPAIVGLLGAIPALGATAAGAIGTLVLAFQGMGKAIGGDKEAFDKLQPAQKAFVQEIRSMHDWVGRLKETAAVNLFPGLSEGLKAAFSPGTTALITRSVAQFGMAIGQAGAQWGRYFGSAAFQQSFGPLMQAGARNLGILSDAALHLFDALGVLGLAAIPLTNWITDSIDRGAQLASSWLRSKDASGALARGMTEAQSSLRLVGGLLVAAGRAVYALGAALYPVAKQAVKALTDGLNALAGIIRRNQGAIREIVGALLTGLVTAVKLAAGGVRLLVDGLGHFMSRKNAVIAAIGAMAAAWVAASILIESASPWLAIITAAVLAVGLIVRHWSTVKDWFARLLVFLQGGFHATWEIIKGGAQAAAGAILTYITAAVRGILEGLSRLPFGAGKPFKKALDGLKSVTTHWVSEGVAQMKDGGEMWGKAFGDAFHKSAAQSVQDTLNTFAAFVQQALSGTLPAPKQTKPKTTTTTKTDTSVFGTPQPFDKNVPKPKKDDTFTLPFALRLAQAKADVTASTADDLRVAERISSYIRGLISRHKIAGEKLIGAYEALASVTSQIAAAAQAAADKLKQFTVPLRLQVAQARFEALGQAGNVRDVLRKIRAAAEAALKSGRLSLEGQLEAWQTIAQVNDELKKTTQDKADVIKANEREFLASFGDLITGFANNFQTPANPRTDTHLHDLVNETRQSNKHLGNLADSLSYPDSAYHAVTAGAIAG